MRELRSLDLISHPSDMIPNINNDILSLKEMFKINKFSKAYSRLRAFKNKFK
jgi:hypothetical protein